MKRYKRFEEDNIDDALKGRHFREVFYDGMDNVPSLATYHKAVKKYCFADIYKKDKEQIDAWLKDNRWMLGNGKEMDAYKGAKLIRSSYDEDNKKK
jgi:hypothetical protein